jgi:hypothetical protein
MADAEEIERGLGEAGWKTDGNFSEHMIIGECGELCVLIHRSTHKTDEPTYELYDVDRHVSYWVHKVPTPEHPAMLLEEHGETPEEG